MTTSRLGREFDAYSDWRDTLRGSVSSLRDWLNAQKVGDGQTLQRVEQLLHTVADDRLNVAFVAEFSRGKSELINAVFFGDKSRRVVPSSAGRTTMCPSELLHDPDHPPGMRLLPIETRAGQVTVAEFKSCPEEWEFHPLDPEDPGQMSRLLAKVTEVKLVDVDHAQSLGLPVVDDPVRDDGVSPRGDGMVEIPRWRHAIVNMPHPLLKQGLVVIDTPGLNALGAEPELTLGLLSSAQVAVFILAADAGVTKSDMAVWRDHILVSENKASNCLVVLNKIDVLWDDLRNAEEVRRELQRQIDETSETLRVPEASIFPLSAQKALLAKVRGDAELLEASGITIFESALADLLIPSRRDAAREHVGKELDDISQSVRAVLDQRLRDVTDHTEELERLSSKNVEVIDDMMEKVREDKSRLEKNLQRFQATRAVFAQQTDGLYRHLSMASLDRLIAESKKDMEISLTTAGLRRNMLGFFESATSAMENAARQANDIQDLMGGVYKRFQEEHGLANLRPRRFTTSKYLLDIRRLRDRHDHFMHGVGMLMTEQNVLVRKFYESVVSKIRQTFERANRDADQWLRTVMSPMESEVREHQVQLRRRLESIKRIHKASDTVEDRLTELRHVGDEIRKSRDEAETLFREIDRHLAPDPARSGAVEIDGGRPNHAAYAHASD